MPTSAWRSPATAIMVAAQLVLLRRSAPPLAEPVLRVCDLRLHRRSPSWARGRSRRPPPRLAPSRASTGAVAPPALRQRPHPMGAERRRRRPAPTTSTSTWGSPRSCRAAAPITGEADRRWRLNTRRTGALHFSGTGADPEAVRTDAHRPKPQGVRLEPARRPHVGELHLDLHAARTPTSAPRVRASSRARRRPGTCTRTTYWGPAGCTQGPASAVAPWRATTIRARRVRVAHEVEVRVRRTRGLARSRRPPPGRGRSCSTT